MVLTPGARLGPYEVLSRLGEGGMGEVYRACDTRLGRDVALKVLPEAVVADAGHLARFEREARTLAAVNHPGIVTIFAVETIGDVRVLAMELVEGTTLRDQTRSGGLSAPVFLDIAGSLVEAVSAAHACGIVHRDLKPANIMLTVDGRVKVLDFGLAKTTVSDATETRADLTAAGTVVGTTAYMAPEQARGQAMDARSDVFSLGIVFYELLAGTRPFVGPATGDLLSAILRDEPRPIGELRPDLPSSLTRIVQRCLRKRPADRYQTGRDLLDDLRRVGTDATSQIELPSGATGTGSGTGTGDAGHGGFWISVQPFKGRGGDPIPSVAEGMTEDIVTGLSRFSYLRVIALSGERLQAARYVLEGSLRQAGRRLRVAVQLVDAVTGAHLWAETYDRTLTGDLFGVVDDIVPRIVSTIADMNGVLPRTMSGALRARDPDDLTPYEAVLRSFGYLEQIAAEEHAHVRACLERTVTGESASADGWAMLSFVYAEEFKHDFNVRPGSLDRALEAARKAVSAAPSSHLAYHVLAQALFFRRELDAFRRAAERAVALNPMDGCTTAFMGILRAYAGEWDEGCALAERAMQLNTSHPGWYHFAAFFNAYRRQDYRGALDVAIRFNMPTYFYTHMALAAAYGQLGDTDAARRSLAELLVQKPDFAVVGRAEFGKWTGPGALLEQVFEGLRKAGLSEAHA